MKQNSLYIHFPYCRHLCNYCDFYKRDIKDNSKLSLDHFDKLLLSQWYELQRLLDNKKVTWSPLKSLYLGGGTPSLWGEKGIDFLKKNIFRDLTRENNCEFTLELDPKSYNIHELLLWKEIGVNRISIGMQSFDDDMLKVFDRQHSVVDIRQTLTEVKEVFQNISCDFMIGAPQLNNNKRNIIQEISHLIDEFDPEHFSVYILQTRKNYKWSKNLPTDEQQALEYKQVSQFLVEKGYVHYEVSNFAKKKPKRDLRSIHNLSYWRGESVGAIGPSATGLIVDDSFSQNSKAFRYKWAVTDAKFESEELSESQYRLEKVYQGLRSHVGVNLKSLASSKEDLDILMKIYSRWIEAKYLINDSQFTKVLLSADGWSVLDFLMDDLFQANLL